MDYHLFWEAFGAIGTTLGSIITAIAVIVAVIQYRQPLIKRAKVEFNLCYPMYTEETIPHIAISIKNIGVRDIQVGMFYLYKGKKEYVLINLQSELFPPTTLPQLLKPEEKITLYMREDIFLSEINLLYEKNRVSKFGKWYPVVHDSIGKVYKGKPIKSLKRSTVKNVLTIQY